jgi:hypothetical protein
MKKFLYKIGCLSALLFPGIQLQADTTLLKPALEIRDEAGKEWLLLEIKDGVSCYFRIVPLGTGNGVNLRFVNGNSNAVTINWEVRDGAEGHLTEGKTTLDAYTSVDSKSDNPAAWQLTVRVSSDKPLITFHISK